MRWVVRLIGFLVVLVVIAIGALLMLPGDRIAAVLASQVESSTGRKLTFEGDLSVTFWPVLGVSTGPVELANADWAGDEPMFRADSLNIGVAAMPLLSGDIHISHVIAAGPALMLQTNAEGRGNWELGDTPSSTGDSPTDASGGSSLPQAVELVEIRDAKVTYAAHGAEPVVIDGVDIALDWPDPAGAADIKAALSYGGAPLEVSAQVQKMAALLQGGESGVTLNGTGAGAEFGFDGLLAPSGQSSGAVTAKIPDSAAFAATLGAGEIEIPKGLGRSVDLSTNASYSTEGELALDDLKLVLDGNSLNGAVKLVLAGKPAFTVDLSAGALDLSGLTGGAGGGSGSGGASSGWSKDPIDASALGLADGTLTLAADSIDTGMTRLGKTVLVLTLDDSRAQVDLQQVSAFGGSVTGQVVANNRKGFSVRADLSAGGIEMQRLLGDLAGIDRLNGKGSARLSALGSGNSVDAIMHSLSGDGAVDVGRGVISGIDLDKLLRSGDMSGGTTVFDSLKATWSMSKGNLYNKDLVLMLLNFRGEGEGRVGLGAQDIDYLFTPIALKTSDGSRLAVPIRIRGPWSGPSIIPDLEAAMKGQLEDKVKDELKKKLGGDDTGGSIEDQIKKGLGGLLGGN